MKGETIKSFSKRRILVGPVRWWLIISSFTCLVIVLFYLFHVSPFGYTMIENGYYYAVISLLMPFVFIIFPISKNVSMNKVPWYDILLAVLTFAICVYFFSQSYNITLKGWMFSPPLKIQIASYILCILCVEAGRRAGGFPLGIICLFFALLPTFADKMPAILKGNSYSLTTTISLHAIGLESILGIPLRTVARLLIGFMVFGVVLQLSGGGKFFLNIALCLLGMTRGGAAKVSVIASGLFGSLSGSVVSNVITTGTMTIPSMKKTGYPDYYAAAVEACSSTGGVLMPPVMGATAFIMAELLSIPYYTIVIAAIVPSLLYYTALFIQVDAFAATNGIKGLRKEEIPSLKITIKEGWFYLFAFALLIWLLLYERLEEKAPFYASALLLFLATIRKETRFTYKKLLSLFEEIGRVLAELTGILVAIGFIVGSLMLTGVATSFATELIRLAGGNFVLLLLLGAMASFILGMGMTVTACYIILALVLAPALTKIGFDPLAVHLFVMYCGMISFITPPVAVGAYAAASLAGADPTRTGIQAMRLGITLFFIPFFFVLSPTLILHGPPVSIIFHLITAFIGVILIGGSLEGFLVGIGKLSIWIRSLLIIGGVLLNVPEWRTDLLGAVMVTLILGFQKRKALISYRRRKLGGIEHMQKMKTKEEDI